MVLATWSKTSTLLGMFAKILIARCELCRFNNQIWQRLNQLQKVFVCHHRSNDSQTSKALEKLFAANWLCDPANLINSVEDIFLN